MRNFIIQTGDNTLDVEEKLLKDLLDTRKYDTSYVTCTLAQLSEKFEKGMIPVGTIEFVTEYLKNDIGFNKEVPIEIPLYLQKEEFLKRDYKIVKQEDIPRKGNFFLKDVSELKSYMDIINTAYTNVDELFVNNKDYSLVLNKEHYFQVSSIIDIKTEYRVYVVGGDIVGISYYNGNPLLFPDVKLLQKAVALIEYNEKFLKSYTIDVAVTAKSTAIIEIHNFTSIGLYSTLWGNELIFGYIDGIEYLKHDNSIKYI